MESVGDMSCDEAMVHWMMSLRMSMRILMMMSMIVTILTMMMMMIMIWMMMVTVFILRCELTTTQHQWLLQLLQPTFLNPVLVGLLLLLNRFVHITLYLDIW